MKNTDTLLDAIHESFGKAIENEENILDDGSINWDFVSADVFMDMADQGHDALSDLQTQIDMLIDGHLDDEMLLEQPLSADFEMPAYMKVPEFPSIRKQRAVDQNWSQKAQNDILLSGNRHERRVRARLLKKQKKAS
jgi:hypothetical protein